LEFTKLAKLMEMKGANFLTPMECKTYPSKLYQTTLNVVPWEKINPIYTKCH
jgi:hypothetical protein